MPSINDIIAIIIPAIPRVNTVTKIYNSLPPFA